MEPSGGVLSARERKKEGRSLASLVNPKFDTMVVEIRYAENELPQPQLFTAFGFSNVKPRFSRPS
jgi:hypothetical protein